MTLAEIVTLGDRRKSLAALRDRVAAEMDALTTEHQPDCQCECGPPANDGRVVVQVSKELARLIAELDGLPAAEGVSDVDEVARKRAQRRSRAAAKGKA